MRLRQRRRDRGRTQARNPVAAYATIPAGDPGGRMQHLLATQTRANALAKMSSGLAAEAMAPLAGRTPPGLTGDIMQHMPGWPFASKVDTPRDRTALIVTSDDGLAGANDASASALGKAGDSRVATVHLPTDRACSDQRLELSKAVLAWLASLPK